MSFSQPFSHLLLSFMRPQMTLSISNLKKGQIVQHARSSDAFPIACFQILSLNRLVFPGICSGRESIRKQLPPMPGIWNTCSLCLTLGLQEFVSRGQADNYPCFTDEFIMTLKGHCPHTFTKQWEWWSQLHNFQFHICLPRAPEHCSVLPVYCPVGSRPATHVGESLALSWSSDGEGINPVSQFLSFMGQHGWETV